MKQTLLLLLIPISIWSQNTIALPDVINYNKNSYKGGLQNWDIKQDKQGIVYVANNEGLLSFDGKYWNLYPLPNKTIVRSLAIGEDNKIYVGGQDELGYFAATQNGTLQYHSLISLLPSKDKSFGDVWDIIIVNKSVLFRSDNKIFKLINESISTYNAPTEWSYLGVIDKQVYAHDLKTGLMSFHNDVWMPIFEKNELPENERVTGLLEMKKDSILVTSLKKGLFILHADRITKIQSYNNSVFETERIYAATRVNDDWFALASNNNGIRIVDKKGNIIQSFSRTDGLQNNNVLSIFLDNQFNLWLGLDNGIDFIAYNSAVKHINPLLKNGSGYTAQIFKNLLYIGTSNGLYGVQLEKIKDYSFSRGAFETINNIKGQTWGLATINNQLLLGMHEGAFEVKDFTAIPISDNSTPGYWNFVPLSNTFPAPRLIAGNYKGLSIFDYQNGRFTLSGSVNDFSESSRFVEVDKEGILWVSHPYHGVYRIRNSETGDYQIAIYTEKNGLPSTLNNHVYKIKNEIVVATEKGIFTFNSNKNIFEKSDFYFSIFNTLSLRYVKEDTEGNIWFIHEKNLGVVDMSGKKPAILYIPEVSNKMVSGYDFVYPANNENIFVGSESGFFHINYEKYKRNKPTMEVHIRKVRINGKYDSLLFGGHLVSPALEDENFELESPKIKNKWKSIQFEFSSAMFGYQSNLEFRYRLKEFEEKWSEWSSRTEKEYTNLPPGKYSFEVIVRNNLGNESVPAVYTFIILAPWYLSTWANIVYFLLFAGLIYGMYKWQKKKFLTQKKLFEAEEKRLKYIYDLEKKQTENELIELRNEKLETDISFKNSELASSAMHLVKKGELLSKIKSELTKVSKGFENPQAISEIKKMIKTLDQDDNIDEEWGNFSKHFDKVHSDFLVSLKEKHPAITPSELKLSAYLRMNLSTKEVAQLMNISVRGVEIGRYRLRKKLGITTQTNLFDYLINI